MTENSIYINIPRDGREEKLESPLLKEHSIEIYVNGVLTMKLVCTPENLNELVIGRLRTKGIIKNISDIKSLHICGLGLCAEVYLNNQNPVKHKEFVEETPTCCTNNHILNKDFVSDEEIPQIQSIPWDKAWIFKMADTFEKGMPLHTETLCTHSCFLGIEGEILFQCEDIGRHNALDKVIGYALQNEIPLNKCIVYSSGRLPTDMVWKAIRAGIPVLASKSMPTAEGVALAKKHNLTLICGARKDRMKLYSGQI